MTLFREEFSGSSSWNAGLPGSLNVTDVVGALQTAPTAVLKLGRISTKMSWLWLGMSVSFSFSPAELLRRAYHMYDVRYQLKCSKCTSHGISDISSNRREISVAEFLSHTYARNTAVHLCTGSCVDKHARYLDVSVSCLGILNTALYSSGV